jgi:hypothetical protein
VSQSVSLGVEPHLGLITRYLLLFDSYSFVFVGSPLWWEDGSVFCIRCWPLLEQSFSGLSPLGLATIFYCLRFGRMRRWPNPNLPGGAGEKPRRTSVRISDVPAKIRIERLSNTSPRVTAMPTCSVWPRSLSSGHRRGYYLSSIKWPLGFCVA